MKKLILFVVLGLLSGAILFFVTNDTPDTPSLVLSEKTNSTTPFPTKKAEVSTIIEEPQTIRIPSINVIAVVERVGLDEKQNMDIPKKWENAGWYELGFKPGEKGSAVIAAHYDTPQGEPGVFYDISNLKPGDEVIVEGNGKTLTFTVIETKVYKFDEVPLHAVFNSTDKNRLNLITCDGVFDKNEKNYSNRLIVYTELSK